MKFFLKIIVLLAIFTIFLLPPKNYFGEELIVIGNNELNVQTAQTKKAHLLGLSNRKNLEPFDGLLFIFEQPKKYGIWMKDMNFPIDVVWIDENKKVIWMEKEIYPETYPKVFKPEKPALFVLELPANKANQIEIGSLLKRNNY